MIADLGTASLAVAVPGAASAAVAIDVSCGIAAPNVEAQLTALASFTPSVSLSLAAQLDIATSTVANIEASIAAGITPPSLSAQVDMALAIIAELEAKLVTVQAQLAISVALQAQLATGGVRLLTYSGARDAFGAELAAELGVGAASCNALVLLTESGAAWTAMQGVFKTS
jgi:hypothetical protein